MYSQKHLFALDDQVTYLNCAAYSPLLQSSIEAGNQGIRLKSNPQNITSVEHFFDNPYKVRELFSTLTNARDSERIAIIPAVSYGMATVAKNIHRIPDIQQKTEIILLQEEFPNNVYGFDRECVAFGLNYKTIEAPNSIVERGKIWNESILNAISTETAMVVIPHVHWIYGVKFDLETISKRCKEVGALLIVDGTQSVGMLPFDIQKFQPDALICASYKWMLSSYGLGLAYYGEFFDEGVPIEETWMNRQDSEKFAQLTNYERAYRQKAQRYNVGEYSQFAQMPMLQDSLTQILDWGVDNMQAYCSKVIEKPLLELQDMGCQIESEAYRGSHLFGIILPINIDSKALFDKIIAQNIFVSLRNGAIRVSPNVYNDESDLWALSEVIKSVIL
jgi:selenocysteine lyase/cysteine desulfurase